MLPWRIEVQRLIEAFRVDGSFRRGVLAVTMAMALLIGAFTSGFELSLRFGGDDGLAVGAASAFGSDSAGGTGSTTAAGGTRPGAGGGGSTTGTSAGTGLGGTSGAGGSRSGGAGGTSSAGGQSGGGSSAGGGPSGPAPSCDGASLAATDQGVSETEVELGVLIPNLNQLQAAGFNVGLQGDYDRILEAWVKELNERRGGVGCRSVTTVQETFDVLSVDDMIAKCKAMTEDHQVFSVITPGGYDSVAQLCIAKDHQTPFINPEPEPEGWYRESAPYLWNLLMSKDRMHRNHVRYLVDSGLVVPGDPNALTGGATRVGVVYHGIPNVAPPVEDTMLPELERLGVHPVSVASLSSDNEQALAQISQVVLQFQRERVDFVLMPMNLIFKTQFMQQAEAQQYFPTYSDSDHYFGCFDFVTATYPASSWDGTRCVSSLELAGMRTDDALAYVGQHPFGQYADEVYLRAFPDGYDRGGQASEDETNTQRLLHIGLGSQILLWEQAADRVGPDLTRAAWGAAMGQTGEFHDFVAPHPLSFGPEKWEGPDYVTVVEWHAEAGDGYEERQYRRITEPFPAQP